MATPQKSMVHAAMNKEVTRRLEGRHEQQRSQERSCVRTLLGRRWQQYELGIGERACVTIRTLVFDGGCRVLQHHVHDGYVVWVGMTLHEVL